MRATQSRKLLTCFFSFGAFAALAKAFAGEEFGQTPRGCGLNSGWATPLAIFQAQVPTHHQPWLSARSGFAALAIRLLQETSFGQTLAVVGSTPVGLLLLLFAKPGAHGLAADLATGGLTTLLPPGM